MNFDNSNSGALFPTAVDGVLSGPWQYGKKQDNKHMLVAQLGTAGSEHKLCVHLRKKDGSAGKVIETGSVKAIPNGGAPSKSGVGFTPVARGELGDVKVVLFRQENTKQGGFFYQVKPDAFEARELPPL